LAVILVPDSSELARRVVADGNTDRIHELAKEALDDDNAPIEAPAVPLTTAQKLRNLASQATAETLTNPAVFAEFSQLCAGADSPMDMLIEIGTLRRTLPTELCSSMVESLAKRALGLGKPNEAAIIYTTLVKQDHHPDALATAVKCWRWAGQPARALALIDELTSTNPGAVSRELLDLRSTLALESNQPNRAYDLAFTAYGQSGTEDRGKALSDLVALAHSGDRFEKATPLLEHHLAGLAFTRQPLSEAVTALQSDKAFPTPAARAEFLNLGSSLAHWHEWAEPPQPEPALAIYFKLALLNDDEAYARCKDLYPDLLLQEDFTSVLDYLVSEGKHLDDEPLLAQLLAEAGQPTQAAAHFRAALARNELSIPLWRSLAAIYIDTADAAQALEPLQKLIHLAPQDQWAHRELANASIQLGHFSDALPELAHLAALDPNNTEILESYYSLADSLAQPKAASEALAQLIAVPNRTPEVDEYLDLATLYQNQGLMAESLQTLRTGFHDFGESPRMRMNYAQCLSEAHPGEAMLLLCHSSLNDNTEAVKLLAECALRTANPRAALTFLEKQKPACLRDLPVARFQLAIAYERTGGADQATHLIGQLLEDHRYEGLLAWQTLAQTSLDMGDNERAERFQERYVAYHGINDSKAWSLLGDIYTLRGKTTEATAAYERSLRSLIPAKKTRALADVPSLIR
jgi:tetratricopeptide (TPR) repeat protein